MWIIDQNVVGHQFAETFFDPFTADLISFAVPVILEDQYRDTVDPDSKVEFIPTPPPLKLDAVSGVAQGAGFAISGWSHRVTRSNRGYSSGCELTSSSAPTVRHHIDSRPTGDTFRGGNFSFELKITARLSAVGIIDENCARLRTHRNNINRYRQLLATELTKIERGFIEQRLSEEQSKLESLAGMDISSELPTSRSCGSGYPGLNEPWRRNQYMAVPQNRFRH